MKALIHSFSDDFNPSSGAGRDRALATGLAFQFAAQSRNWARVPISAFAALTHSAIQVDQMRVYVNSAFECLGYVIWGLLTPDLEEAYIAGRPRPLADWEFNDGTSPWVLDFDVVPLILPKVLEDLRDVVFKDYQHVTYHRFKGPHRLCKRISRSDRSSFMAAGRSVIA